MSIKTAAIAYGRKHEKDAISLYIGYHESKGTNIEVTKRGLTVDASDLGLQQVWKKLFWTQL